MTSQTVYCPNCNALVAADDINIQELVCKCAECGQVFPLPTDEVAAGSPAVDDEPEPALPSGVQAESGPNGELFIRRSWFTSSVIFLLLFSIVWIGFLVFWSMKMFGDPNNGAANAEEAPIWVPFAFGAAGLFMLYSVVAGFLNTTRMLVDHETIFIRHSPIPWPGNRDLPAGDIQSFELSWTTSKGGSREGRYRISAHHTDERRTLLLNNLQSQQANFIGYKLSKYLSVPFKKLELPNVEKLFTEWKKSKQKN